MSTYTNGGYIYTAYVITMLILCIVVLFSILKIRSMETRVSIILSFCVISFILSVGYFASSYYIENKVDKSYKEIKVENFYINKNQYDEITSKKEKSKSKENFKVFESEFKNVKDNNLEKIKLLIDLNKNIKDRSDDDKNIKVKVKVYESDLNLGEVEAAFGYEKVLYVLDSIEN